MAIVIFFAAYAISSVSRSVLNPYLGQWPILGLDLRIIFIEFHAQIASDILSVRVSIVTIAHIQFCTGKLVRATSYIHNS